MTEAPQLFAPAARAPRSPRSRVRRPLVLGPELTAALAGGKLRLLAVDQGSLDAGFAFLEGERVVWTKRLSPSDGWSWQRRMRWITDHVRELLVRSDPPQVVAIEDIVAHRGVPNLQSLVTMGEQRGWLMCALEYWYPGIRQLAIPPASVRSVTGAPRGRAAAKEHTQRGIAALTGIQGLTEDESDAVAIGLAARSAMQRAALLARAGA